MHAVHGGGAQALGSRGAHIIVVEYFEHRGACDARDDRQWDSAQRDAGQDEVLDGIPQRASVDREQAVDHIEVGVMHQLARGGKTTDGR